MEKRSDRFVGAGFCQMGFQDVKLHDVGLGFEQSGVALTSRRSLGGTLNVENDPASGQKGAQLMSLDAADLFVVRGDSKCWHMENAAEFGNVVGVAVQQHHPNASVGGSAGNLRMRG